MAKNNIVLIFCPWLNLENAVGVFFIEQAEIIRPKYEPILVNFVERRFTFKNLVKRKVTSIHKNHTKSGIMVLEVRSFILPKYLLILNEYINLLTLKSLNKYLAKNDIFPLLIHAQSLFSDGIRAYNYFIKFNVPYVLSEHNQLSFINKSKSDTDLALKALNHAKVNLAISSDKIRQFAASWLFPKFEFVGNLISPQFEYFESKFAKNSTVRLITVGAYTPIKDHHTLFRALQIVDREIDFNITFLWVGTNGWGNNVNEEVNKFLENYEFVNIEIIIKPLLSREELAVEYLHSNLFLFSSISEGMPVSMLEALASGLPVFTTNCGGADDIINMNNGRIFPVKDYQIMAYYILEFLNKSISFNNKFISEEIISRFGSKAFKARLLSIYDSI